MKEYICKAVHNPINIDGDVQKEVWKSANAIRLVETATGRETMQGTEAKMLYDSQYLYVAFDCIDDEIHATLTNYNDFIFNEEVVEIFIDSVGDRKTYTELEVSPINTLLHYMIHNDGKQVMGYARVEKVVDTAVQRYEQGWSVEMKIPLQELAFDPPKKGSCWYANLYRIDRREKGEDEYSAWCPTGKINFHLPNKFGKIIFE